LLVETAREYWVYAQRLNRASSDASRRLLVDHEILPAAYGEKDDKRRALLFRLVARAQAA
jgi:hypothetical protein